MNTANHVSKVYKTVVEDVINNVKEAFLDEGVDEQVLQELRLLWEGKLSASKAMEAPAKDNSAIAPGNVILLPQPVPTSIQHGAAAIAPAVQGQPNHQFQQSASAATATLALPTSLFQQQLAALGPGGQIQNITVQQTGNGQFITLAGLSGQFQQQQPRPQIPQQITTQMIHQQRQQSIRLPIQPHPVQQQQTAQRLVAAPQRLQSSLTTLPAQAQTHKNLIQLDGNGDSSSSDEDFDDDDKDEEEKEDEEEEHGEEEEPLNSADDVSEEDPNELFDTENVVVCQFDKINRNKNKWKFHLKDGIMNLNGRDFVFQKATGDSEW